ncbi:MAG: hypothetical protein FWG14_03385 [Peptococcaceae bacterium]|nr:hypothetical protein [Peptococcaceae bacterium]
MAARRFEGIDVGSGDHKDPLSTKNLRNSQNPQNPQNHQNPRYGEFFWRDDFSEHKKKEVGQKFSDFTRGFTVIGHGVENTLRERVHALVDFRHSEALGYSGQNGYSGEGAAPARPLETGILDTAVLARVFFPRMKHYSLAALGTGLGLGSAPVETPAEITQAIGRIFMLCWEKALSYDVSYFLRVEEVVRTTIYCGLFEEMKKSVAGGPGRGVMTGLFAREEGEEAGGTNSANSVKGVKGANDVTGSNDVKASWQKRGSQVPKDFQWPASCFGKKGLLASALPGFESRQAQVVMAQHIVDAFDAESHMVIEAETGTGKSMAYLLPALWWAKLMEEKVIVATHTIVLQEQLFTKDLPFLAETLPFSFRAALLKGRNHYICPLLFEQSFPQREGFVATRGAAHTASGGTDEMVWPMLLSWLRETETGDFNELPRLPQWGALWQRLNAETALCSPARCRYARRCFMLKARQKAQEADVVVINHSLLFSDMKMGMLPEYHYLVVDEAHHLYESALAHLGFALNRENVSRLTERWRKTGRGSTYAMWLEVARKMGEMCSEYDFQSFTERLHECPSLAARIDEQAAQTFDVLAQILGDRVTARLTLERLPDSVRGLFAVEMENLSGRLEGLDGALHGMWLSLDGARQLEEFKYDIVRDRALLGEWIRGLRQVAELEDDQRITYVEKSSGEKVSSLWLKSAPLDIAALLEDQLFNEKKSVILCSATLSVAGDFRYFMGEIGLKRDCAGTLALRSQFDYQSQMLSCIVSGFAPVGAGGERRDLQEGGKAAGSAGGVNREAVNSEAYVNGAIARISPIEAEGGLAREVASFVAEAARLVGGRTLVLFTSHRLLRLVNQALEEFVGEDSVLAESSPLEILAQGIHGSRDALLDDFRAHAGRVLLGSSSFWEGIDLPGEELSCLIMVRLPFWPPSMPVIEARSELLRKKGRNPFYDLQLPEAVIRFKQGFGRLLRTREDRGVFILLDDRVVTKRYGMSFLASLPKRNHMRGDREQVLGKVREFFH